LEVSAGFSVSEPAVALVPDQPPLAVQLVAFVLDHVSVMSAPYVIEGELEVSVTVGAELPPDGGGVEVPLLPPPPPPHAASALANAPTVRDRNQEMRRIVAAFFQMLWRRHIAAVTLSRHHPPGECGIVRLSARVMAALAKR
jgi:hypothetical protein